MQGDPVPFTVLVHKIGRGDPRKVVYLLRVESNGPPPFFCSGQEGFPLNLVVAGPDIKIEVRVHPGQFPAGIAFGDHARGPEDVAVGDIKSHIEGGEFAVELADPVERFMVPALLIVDHHFRVPLRQVVLVSSPAGAIVMLAHRVHPVHRQP